MWTKIFLSLFPQEISKNVTDPNPGINLPSCPLPWRLTLTSTCPYSHVMVCCFYHNQTDKASESSSAPTAALFAKILEDLLYIKVTDTHILAQTGFLSLCGFINPKHVTFMLPKTSKSAWWTSGLFGTEVKSHVFFLCLSMLAAVAF